jgi:hypothetical protein
MWFQRSGGHRKNLVGLSFPVPPLSCDIYYSLVFYFTGSTLPFPTLPHHSSLGFSSLSSFSSLSYLPAGTGSDSTGWGRRTGVRAGGRLAGGRRSAGSTEPDGRRCGGQEVWWPAAGGRGEASSIWWFCEFVMNFVLIVWRTCDYWGAFLWFCESVTVIRVMILVIYDCNCVVIFVRWI